MNNKSFIAKLSERTAYTAPDTQKMVTTLVDTMTERLMQGDTLDVPRFGVFEVKKRLERIVTNPTTKRRMLVPPKLVLTFRADSTVKDKLKTGGTDNG